MINSKSKYPQERTVIMVTGISTWFKNMAESGNSAWFKKNVPHLERHNKIPLPYFIRQEFSRVTSTLVAKIKLRKCDKVGLRPRTCRKLYVKNAGEITIGNDLFVNSRNVPTHLITGPGGVLEIGDKVSIDFGVCIEANRKIVIGDGVTVGPHTMIDDSKLQVHDDRLNSRNGASVVVEDNVNLESKVVIRKGSRIGRGSLITAGSVVSGIIPPYVIAGGIPAKVIKFLNPPARSGFHWENIQEPIDKRGDIARRVREIASEVFSTDINMIQGEYSHSSIPNWNSLQHVKFIHAMEREFDVKVTKEDWTKMSSFGGIVRVIQTGLEQKYKNQKSQTSMNDKF